MIQGYAREVNKKSKDALTYDDVQIVPQYSNVMSRSNISTKTRLVGDVYIDHPVIPANMDTICGVDMCIEARKNGGIAFLHRFKDEKNMASDIKTLVDELDIIPLTVGTDKRSLEHIEIAQSFLDRKRYTGKKTPIVVMIDVAHGHHIMVRDMIFAIRERFPEVFVIAGNVATYEGALDLCKWGANGIKVGVGPGSLCTTRINTGAGFPQFSAVVEAERAIDDYCLESGLETPTIIADGGIKYIGDIVKAIGAGANTVMCGYLFAGTSSTPGNIISKGLFPNESLYKVYRGSASRESKLDRGETSNVEGTIVEIPYKGETSRIFKESLDGIRSGLSYAGHSSIDDAVGEMKFVKVSAPSIIEASPGALYRHS